MICFFCVLFILQETPVPLKKSQKDLENEREKSRIIHEFIAKSNIPLYNCDPAKLYTVGGGGKDYKKGQ